MNVQDCMSQDVYTIDSKTTVAQAASAMKKNNVGWLPILSGSKIEGVITDRDIVIRCIVPGLDPKATDCRQIMSRNCHACHSDDSVQRAVDLMEEKRVRRLAVLDDRDELCGVISMTDFATRMHDQQLCGEIMERVCMAPANA